MSRIRFITLLVAAASLVAPVLRADVKTQEKDGVKFGGALGSMLNHFGGASTKEGLVSTVAIKGDRKISIAGDSGTIIDLGEEKVYNLDMKGKTYKVTTFAELRAAWEKAKADAQKNAQQMKPEDKQQAENTAKQYQIDADVKETGQRKSIAGYDTKEVIVTIVAHEQGKTLDESGGLVMTSDMWLAPKIAALDELTQFNLRYAKAIYGESLAADMQQMAHTMAMYPTFSPMSTKMQSENTKLTGTVLQSTTTFDSVKSAEEMKAAQDQQQQTPTSTSSLGSAIAKHMMGNKGQPTPRSTVFTANHEVLSVSPTVTGDDVALPANFKEKK